MKKFFIVAGEASGDLHAANLAKALQQQEDDCQIIAWGGKHLRDAGATVTKDYKELAIMGFVEIISKLPQIFKNLKQAVSEVKTLKPDAVVLVDFSGFNLRLAKKLRKEGYSGKIFYYISPKLWVWNTKRVEKVKQYIDAMFCILPFEVDFYQEHNYNQAYYIGNPLMDEIAAYRPNEDFLRENHLIGKPVIALLPGSRSNEIRSILPKMLKVVPDFPDYQFVIAGVESVKDLIEKELNSKSIKLPIVYDSTYDLVHHADAALVTSGTATLEVALLDTPLALCYSGNALSFAIAKSVVKIDFIGLPNLILGREMIKELIQSGLTEEAIHNELNALLHDDSRISQFQIDQKELTQKVGNAGASKKAANIMLDLLS